MILHRLENRLYRLAAEIVVSAGCEGICLVYEQHAAECRLDNLLRFQCRLSDIARNKAGAVDFYKLTLAQHADRCVQSAYEARHGGLAGAGIAEENHVQTHRRNGQIVLLTQTAYLHKVYKILYILLDVFKSDQRIKLCHKLFKVWLLLLLLCGLVRFCRLLSGGLRHLYVRGGVFIFKARLTAGNIVERVQAALPF